MNPNNNGHKKPGRPRNPSVPVTVRLPLKQFDDLDKDARVHRTTIPAILRNSMARAKSLAEQNQQMIQGLLEDRFKRSTAQERADSFVRLLIARANYPNDVAAAIRAFLEHWPEDVAVSYVQQKLEWFQEQNRQRPGSVTAAQFWRML